LTQILIDLAALNQLAKQWEGASQEVGGVVTDLRRRTMDADLGILRSYGLDPGPLTDQLQAPIQALTNGAIELDEETAQLRRQLYQAVQASGGTVSTYSQAQPDLWWMRSGPAGGTVTTAAVNAAGSGTATTAAVPLAEHLLPAGSAALNIQQVTAVRTEIVTNADKWLGIPYLWGGGHEAVVAPGATNVDCSGLVHQVFGESGLSISGTAQTMYDQSAPVTDISSAQPGDLLFWGTPTDIHHVGIYIGDGEMVEAPHTGASVHAIPVYTGSDFAGIRDPFGG